MTTVLLVFAGGAVGAPVRYLTDRWVSSRAGTGFPFGTLVVNLIGCFVLGVVAGAMTNHGLSANTVAVLGTGFCGGLTTYSTFAVEAVELVRHPHRVRAPAYVVLSAGLGVALAELGWLLT